MCVCVCVCACVCFVLFVGMGSHTRTLPICGPPGCDSIFHTLKERFSWLLLSIRWCACFAHVFSFCHSWTNKAEVIEFSVIFFVIKVIEFSVKIGNLGFFIIGMCVFIRTLKFKPTSTEIVLGWVTLQNV